jgi:hypothetical protein
LSEEIARLARSKIRSGCSAGNRILNHLKKSGGLPAAATNSIRANS